VKEGPFPRRAELAFQALERVATAGGFAVVQERLREGDGDAMWVVDSLDAAATRFLVGRIKSTEGLADRVRFAETIARAGPGAATIVIDASQRTTTPTEALRLMEVLPSAIPEKQVETALEGLLRNPAIAVRRRTAVMLAERGYPRAPAFLLRALKEEADPAVRATLAEALGELRCKEAVPALLGLADGRQEADEVRSEACLALGRIADRTALPLLIRLADGGAGGLTSIFRTVTREVRVSATRALGGFHTDLGAREALRRALLDPIPSVRAAAKEAQESQLPAGSASAMKPQDALGRSWKLAGSLGEVPLDQICQLIAASAKGGLLTLQFEGKKARVWFEEGLVVAAEFEGKRDQEAFNLFCRRAGGHFSFRPGPMTEEKRMKAPVMQVLMEAFRVGDESGQGGAA
jgi:HEAT repeat protein